MSDLESAVERLVACGVVLHPEFEIDALVEEWSEEDLLGDPLLLLCALGGDGCAVNLHHFDTECIEDHGDYARIAIRFAEMARGDLPLEKIDDTVDIENDTASLSFTLDGERHEWTCKVDNDWVDADIISRFAELLRTRNTGRRFTYVTTGGQDCVLGCFTDAERKKLASEVGFTIDWLT
jgi:hypothetical protein